MTIPKIIQGGMGVAISDWKLAAAVSNLGQLGVVSGTGIANVMISRLKQGDVGGHIQRAMKAFPFQEPIHRILERYYHPEGEPKPRVDKKPPFWSLKPTNRLMELTVVANFVETHLARAACGYQKPIGINLLEKVQMPNLASLYGTMLAGVTVVIMGAGIPDQVPGILDKLVNHEAVSYKLSVNNNGNHEDIRLYFDPEKVFPGISQNVGKINRPQFFPIVSSDVLAKALIKKTGGNIDGFIIEAPWAGGHNAPPRGPLTLDENGEPLYGAKDEINIEKFKSLGIPFWLAGGYHTKEQYHYALEMGASGIQVGTAFALCEESGMDGNLKKRLISDLLDGNVQVKTDPRISPTGFPFKVVQMKGTIADDLVYQKRERICNMGLLRSMYMNEDGKVIFRCPAEPEDTFLAKGGSVEELDGRGCLCNHLLATAGYPQERPDAYGEPALITAGDSLEEMAVFFKSGNTSYSAKDVIDSILG